MIKLEYFKTLLNNRYILIVTSTSVEKNTVNAKLHAKRSVKIIPENLGCYIGLSFPLGDPYGTNIERLY